MTREELLGACGRVRKGAGSLAFLKVHGDYIADVLAVSSACRAMLEACAPVHANLRLNEHLVAMEQAALRAAGGDAT